VQTLMATLDEVQSHRISPNSRDVLEILRARIVCRYLCNTETPDSACIIHNVQIPDRHGDMKRIQALIDCGATRIFMAPKIVKRLGISHESAHITTLNLDRGVMHHAKNSRTTQITVQYLDYLAPVD